MVRLQAWSPPAFRGCGTGSWRCHDVSLDDLFKSTVPTSGVLSGESCIGAAGIPDSSSKRTARKQC